MADRFRSTDRLVEAVDAESFETPPAIVCNAHVTGLGVARALAAHDVPVIALDRTGEGVAPGSKAVAVAGRVTYPLEDVEGFRADVEAVAAACEHAPVAFGCMDEWVHGLARTEPAGVRLPFAADRVDDVLDKTALYAVCDRLDVPFPETYRIVETDDAAGTDEPALAGLPAAEAADRLGFPLVVKPALKRRFEEAVGTNVVEVADRAEYDRLVETARDEDVRVMAQERVPVRSGADRSYASYVRPSGDAVGIVGAPTRHPRGYGTSCLVASVDDPTVERRARAVLAETGYHGISEAEFVYDTARDEYVLLDVNTRPWKWIGLPVATGANLPYAAYADATGVSSGDQTPVREATWVHLRDYLASLAGGAPDDLTESQWRSLIAGRVDADPTLATGVYSPADPEPTYRLLTTEFGDDEYYCSC